MKSVLLSSRYATTQASAPGGVASCFKGTQPLANAAFSATQESTQKKKKRAKGQKN